MFATGAHDNCGFFLRKMGAGYNFEVVYVGDFSALKEVNVCHQALVQETG